MRYLHNNNMMLLSNSKTKLNFLNFLICVTNFTFVTVPYFSLEMKFFFINKIFLNNEIFQFKTSLEACFYDAILIFQHRLNKVKEHIIDYYIP